jgi:hypothetical protein
LIWGKKKIGLIVMPQEATMRAGHVNLVIDIGQIEEHVKTRCIKTT